MALYFIKENLNTATDHLRTRGDIGNQSGWLFKSGFVCLGGVLGHYCTRQTYKPQTRTTSELRHRTEIAIFSFKSPEQEKSLCRHIVEKMSAKMERGHLLCWWQELRLNVCFKLSWLISANLWLLCSLHIITRNICKSEPSETIYLLIKIHLQ